MADRRMNAYYYSFSPTGVDAVDAILEAVAIAGKAYHHTDQWGEDTGDGVSYAGAIQQAADKAAKYLKAVSNH